MPGWAPRPASSAANQAAIGVLPVPPTPAIVSAATAEYRGVVVGQQVNSRVEGVAAAFVTQDNLGILVTTVDPDGGYGSSRAAYQEMVASIMRSLA